MMKRLNTTNNEEGTYAIVDEYDNIVTKFRSKATAMNWLPKLQTIHVGKILTIKRLK